MKIKQFVREIFAQVKRNWYMPVTEHQIYDTTERVIGTYMGKPLYRRSYETVSPSTENTIQTLVNTSLPENYDAIFITGGFIENTFGAQYPLNMELSSTDYVTTWVRSGLGIGQKVADANKCNQRTVIHIEYTKTTDTTTESKVPFEPLTEYGTEERMIGYWIDGKPLYRKTLTGSTGNETNINEIVNIGVANINNVIHINGVIGNSPINWEYADGSNVSYNSVCVNGAKTGVALRFSDMFVGSQYAITIEYTKTTD